MRDCLMPIVDLALTLHTDEESTQVCTSAINLLIDFCFNIFVISSIEMNRALETCSHMYMNYQHCADGSGLGCRLPAPLNGKWIVVTLLMQINAMWLCIALYRLFILYECAYSCSRSVKL